MSFLNWLRVIVLGIVEGVTEWLPIMDAAKNAGKMATVK